MIPQLFPNLAQFQSHQMQIGHEMPLASGFKPYEALFLNSLNKRTNCLMPTSLFNAATQIAYSNTIANTRRAELHYLLLKRIGQNTSHYNLQSQVQGNNVFIRNSHMQNKAMPIVMSHSLISGEKEVSPTASLNKSEASTPKVAEVKENETEDQKALCPPINPIASKKMYNISLLLFSWPN